MSPAAVSVRRRHAYGPFVRGQTATYLRRDDGVLQILRPSALGSTAQHWIELALTILGLALGAAAGWAGHPELVALLALAVAAPAGAQVVRKRLADRRARIQIRPILPSSDDPVGLRVIRFENRASVVSVPGTAVRLPGTAASPQE